MYVLVKLAFGILEGTYKDMKDHTELILQVLRKTYVLSLIFSFEEGLIAMGFFLFLKQYSSNGKSIFRLGWRLL